MLPSFKSVARNVARRLLYSFVNTIGLTFDGCIVATFEIYIEALAFLLAGVCVHACVLGREAALGIDLWE